MAARRGRVNLLTLGLLDVIRIITIFNLHNCYNKFLQLYYFLRYLKICIEKRFILKQNE